MLIWAVQAFGELLLISMGFSKCEDVGVKYWIKRGPRTEEEGSSAPLVFFHGISPGQCVYLYVTSRLGCDREAVVLMDTPGINMSMGSFDPISREEIVEAVETLCKRHSLKKVCVAGHSYGSITAGYVARDLPERVCQVVLMDPVALQLGLPDVAYNFMYRPAPTLIESLKLYFTSSELTVANSLRYVSFLRLPCSYALIRSLCLNEAHPPILINMNRRHFWWYNKVLYLEDIQAPVTIALAEHDEILNAAAIREYVENTR